MQTIFNLSVKKQQNVILLTVNPHPAHKITVSVLYLEMTKYNTIQINTIKKICIVFGDDHEFLQMTIEAVQSVQS